MKDVSKTVGKVGYYLGYLEGADKAIHGDLKGGIISAGSNYAAEEIAITQGWGYGLAFTLTWEVMDKGVSQTEWYNRLFFGKDSDVYRERGLKNGWYFDHWYKP